MGMLTNDNKQQTSKREDWFPSQYWRKKFGLALKCVV